MRSALRAAVVALSMCACTPLGHHLGGKAAEGAMQKMAERPPEEQGVVAEQVGRGAVRGAADELNSPEVREATKRIAQEISAEVIRHLEAELGAAGTGPLSEAMAGASERLTAAATEGAIDEVTMFAAQCSDGDPQRCLERQVHRLGAAAGAGLLDALRLPFALLCFALGFFTCLLLVLLVRTRSKGSPAVTLHRKHA